jgi:hypothetical protein
MDNAGSRERVRGEIWRERKNRRGWERDRERGWERVGG